MMMEYFFNKRMEEMDAIEKENVNTERMHFNVF